MDDWESTPLGSVAKHSRGYSYSSSELKEAGEPFITLKTFEKGGGFRVDGVKSIEATVPEQFRVSAGSVLIANTDLTRAGDVVGVPAVVPKQFDNAVFSMDATLFIPDVNALDERFLALALGTSESREFMRGNSAGSTVLHLDTSRLDQMPILLPPLKEQKRIAEILDSLDQTIQATEQLITKHRKIRQGLAHDLLHGPPSENRATDRWKYCKLRRMGKIVGGGTPARERPEYWNGTIPWITPSEVTAYSKKHIKETQDYITELGLASSAAKLVPEDTLLITSRASIGFCVLAGSPMTTNQGFKNLIPHDEIDPDFLFHLGNTLSREMTRRASGTTFLEISAHDFGQIEIHLPPLKEQKRIAAILDSADRSIHENEAELAKLQRLRSGLAADLLSGKVRTVAA
ncbi:MAG: restriction endonuclease subunit S [bacterium]|nr:restriction endonuclease subunit S [bacterium]